MAARDIKVERHLTCLMPPVPHRHGVVSGQTHSASMPCAGSRCYGPRRMPYQRQIGRMSWHLSLRQWRASPQHSLHTNNPLRLQLKMAIQLRELQLACSCKQLSTLSSQH